MTTVKLVHRFEVQIQWLSMFSVRRAISAAPWRCDTALSSSRSSQARAQLELQDNQPHRLAPAAHFVGSEQWGPVTIQCFQT